MTQARILLSDGARPLFFFAVVSPSGGGPFVQLREGARGPVDGVGLHLCGKKKPMIGDPEKKRKEKKRKTTQDKALHPI